jgi:hypothetical protein
LTGWTQVGAVSKNTPLFVNTGLSSNTQYFYRVVTVDSNGESATSDVASGFTRVNSTPANLVFSNRTATSMTLSWTALSGMTRYAVYRGLNQSNNEWQLLDSGVTNTTYTDSTTSPLTEYHYRVVGYTASGAASPHAQIFGAAPGPNAVPTPWVSQDIGGVNGAGASDLTDGVFTVYGGGADVWGASDEFHYVSVPMSGDGSITARVSAMENPAASDYSRAGIMIRESTAVGSRYVSMMLHPGFGGVRLQRRTLTNGSTFETNGPIVNAPYWLRLTRSGNVFTGEISEDGSMWTSVSSVTVSMGTNVRTGLAVTARDDAHIHWGKFDNVSTTPTQPVSGEIISSSAAAWSEHTSIPNALAGAFGFTNPAAFPAGHGPSRVSSHPVSDEAHQNALVELMTTSDVAPRGRDLQHHVTEVLSSAERKATTGREFSDLMPISEHLTRLKHSVKFALHLFGKNR